MSGPEDYGGYYWCVRLPEQEEIYLYADSVNIVNSSMVFMRKKVVDEKSGKTEQQVNLILAPGQWQQVYAASCIDGGAVAFEHWLKDGKEKQEIGFAKPD